MYSRNWSQSEVSEPHTVSNESTLLMAGIILFTVVVSDFTSFVLFFLISSVVAYYVSQMS